MRKITLFGDSHTIALRAALRAGLVIEGADITVLRLSNEKKPSIDGDVSKREMIALLTSTSKDSAFVLALRGNQYNMIGLIQHPEPYDMFDPEDPAHLPDDSVALVPYATMRAYFSDSLKRGYGKILAEAARACSVPLLCLAPPPPKEDSEHIMRNAESFFAQAGISDLGVSPAPLRLCLWSMQNVVLEGFCLEHRIRFLWPPEGTRDADGYLDRAYYADDATHANAAYGALVLRQIVDCLATSPEQKGSPA